MAVDYKKVLERLQKQSSKKGGNADYLDLVEGKNVVRVLPGHPNMEGFFEEVYNHRKNTGNNKGYSVICLNHGDARAEDCLICQELEALKNSKDKKDKQLFSSARPKPRFFMNVIDRTDDSVKVLGIGITGMKGILAFVTDEEYGDVLDPLEGTDLIINKTGKGMDTEYTVTAKRNTSPIFEDKTKIKKLLGKSADDTQLNDLTQLKQQFADEPDKALKVWEEGWDALKEDKDEDEDEDKPKSKSKDKAYKKQVKEAEPEPEEEETEDVTKFPRLKSRCSVCGEQRYKTPSGNVCANGHGGAPPLAEGERPSKPSKKYLKEFPEPEEEEPEEEEPEVEEEEAEEEEPKPKSKKASKKPEPEDEEEGLDDLDEILKKHTKKK